MVGLTITDGRSESLLIDHEDDTVSFTILHSENNQIDFCISLEEWQVVKDFIDSSIDKNKLK